MQKISVGAGRAPSPETSTAAAVTKCVWQPRASLPRDKTVLVVVEATEANKTYFGKRGPDVHPAYIDEHGAVCDAGDWHPDPGLDGKNWRVTHWAYLPAPPSPAESGARASRDTPSSPEETEASQAKPQED